VKEVHAYPLSWPLGWKRTSSSQRTRAQFSRYKAQLSIADGLQRVTRELGLIGVRDWDTIISTNVPLRRDGLPRSDIANPEDPGVAVYWKQGKLERVMATDQYDRVADNLAAIAATLEAMRAIKRHGGAEILDRAFTGFTALPAPMAGQKPWRQVLGFDLDYTPTADDVRAQHRVRRGEAHPDRKGGDHDEFLAVQAAYEQAARELGFSP
jgi:hypothetical protein